MATNWTGYSGQWRFAEWENEVLTINARPATGHTLTALATGVKAKADGEKRGIALTGAGTLGPGYTRKFFFAASYGNSAGATKNPRIDGNNDLLAEGNILVDADGKHWVIESTVNPGGADEHFEVETTRRMT